MRIIRIVLAVSLPLLLTPSALAQTRTGESTASTASRMPAALRAAQELIVAAYPELLERPLEFQARFERGEWLVSVAAAPEPVPGQPLAARTAPLPVLVRARATFDAADQLTRFSADGPWLFDAANAVFRESLRQHPEWTGAEADAELRRLGSTTGAAVGFTPRVGPERAALARHLGVGATAGAAAFQWRETAPGAPPDGRLKPLWITEVVATQGGQVVSYRLEYEPVGGRLVGITRTGGAQ